VDPPRQQPPTALTPAHYRTVEVDSRLDRATAALSERERRAYSAAAQRLIARDQPIISLWTRENVAVAQTALGGIEMSPVGDLDFLRHVTRTVR
jgi:ABC-type oligopeptide transport system substrate-binding subunit